MVHGRKNIKLRCLFNKEASSFHTQRVACYETLSY